jgi:hypothetical protein
MGEPKLAGIVGKLLARQRMITGVQLVIIFVIAALVDAGLCALIALGPHG